MTGPIFFCIISKQYGETMSVLDIQPKDTSKGHFYVSLAKSGIRIFAGGVLMAGNIWLAGVCIVLAEVLGVIEEIV